MGSRQSLLSSAVLRPPLLTPGVDLCADRKLTGITIPTGSLMFMSDLLCRIPLPLKIGLPERGQLPDDILDTGQTLAAVPRKLDMAKPRSIRICVLLSKRKRRARDVDADYVGFEINDQFVVGYGLDLTEPYRKPAVHRSTQKGFAGMHGL